MNGPRLALTLGDPAGIGPETIVGAWQDAGVQSVCRPLVVGRPEVVRRAVELHDLAARVVEIGTPQDCEPSADVIPVMSAGSEAACDVAPGEIDARGGQAAYDSLRLAADLALDGAVGGIVTGPLNKAALNAAGHEYPGHTELLGEFCGVPNPAMMLYLPHGAGVVGANGLGVVHTTLHMSLRSALDALSTDSIVQTCELAHEMLGRLAIAQVDDGESHPHPRIGVCALNPHAGEDGLFGVEERDMITPAVNEARLRNLDVAGPFPTDTLMVRARSGEFDGVVAMYHDQGHIALKLLGMHRAVNVTCGLPIVRTSVAHGTAFELAWKGCAETSGVVEAVRVAAALCRTQLQTVESTGADEVF